VSILSARFFPIPPKFGSFHKFDFPILVILPMKQNHIPMGI